MITAAAAIMVCVFGSFVLGDHAGPQAVRSRAWRRPIFVDATLVRMVLVPATMELLGDANWWLPRWLDRVVPTLSVDVDAQAPVGSPNRSGSPSPSERSEPPEPPERRRADRGSERRRRIAYLRLR